MPVLAFELFCPLNSDQMSYQKATGEGVIPQTRKERIEEQSQPINR